MFLRIIVQGNPAGVYLRDSQRSNGDEDEDARGAMVVGDASGGAEAWPCLRRAPVCCPRKGSASRAALMPSAMDRSECGWDERPASGSSVMERRERCSGGRLRTASRTFPLGAAGSRAGQICGTAGSSIDRSTHRTASVSQAHTVCAPACSRAEEHQLTARRSRACFLRRRHGAMLATASLPVLAPECACMPDTCLAKPAYRFTCAPEHEAYAQGV